MTFSLFSRAYSTTDARLVPQARESGEFVDGPVELTAAELRLVAGGEDTSPKGGWIVTTSSTTTV